MDPHRRRRAVLADILVTLLATFTVAACGAAASRPTAVAPAPGGPGGPVAGRTSDVDEASYLAEMIPHHQEAVVAAGNLSRSPRSEMQALGRRIVETQTAEIRQMTDWLGAWYPQQPVAAYRPMMGDLSTASGDELDRAFLTNMIPHHMGAVMMSQRLLVAGAPLHPEVSAFAAMVRDTQREEIGVMRGWLAAWFPGTEPGFPGGMGPGGMGPGGMGPGGMWPGAVGAR